MNVKGFMLTNGATILMEKTDTGRYKNPCSVTWGNACQAASRVINCTVVPLIPFSDGHVKNLREENILMEFTPNEDVIKLYENVING